MSACPRFDIGKLREIGFEQWDPIGVPVPDDEYDTYLLKAAGNLWNGEGVERVADYLVKVEVDWMGLSLVPGVRERARQAASAISDYVQSLRP
jgi:hypothetical protein